MKKVWGLLLLALFPLVADAGTFNPGLPLFKGFIPVRSNRELYVDYVAPRPGMPTVILMNGMTYSTRQWEAYSKELTRRGVGVVRFDFDGMGETLLRYAPALHAFAWDQQVKDAHALFMAMGLRPPLNIVGLSYGGGIGVAYALQYPREVRNLILMAPFTEPLVQQDQWIKSQIWFTRRTFPANPATDDELYDFFLRQIVYTTYPQVEPIVLENPFKLEATYDLVRGIRKFRAVDVADKLPPGTVHLMVAANDQYIPAPVMENFWSKINPAARMSRILIHDSEHKMPEAVPELAAAWTWQILKGNPELRFGRSFEGWPQGLKVRSSDGRDIPINN